MRIPDGRLPPRVSSASTVLGIVGAGRMGRALVTRLTGERELVVVSRRPGDVALEGGRRVPVGTDPAALAGCAAVLLAVPAPGIAEALAWVGPHLGAGAIAVNLATELPTPGLAGAGPRVVGCKIIGQSGQIARGVAAALVVDGATAAERTLLAQLLAPVGALVEAPEQLAASVNELVARHMIAAHRDLGRALDGLALPPAARTAAVANLAVGVWQAVAAGSTGPYLTRLLAELGAID